MPALRDIPLRAAEPEHQKIAQPLLRPGQIVVVDKDKGPVVFQFQPIYVNGGGDIVLAQPTTHAVDFAKVAAAVNLLPPP